MSKLDDLISAAKAEIAEPKLVEQEVVIAGEIVTFEFTKIDGMEWRNLIAKFPARADVVRDRNLGYNYDLVPSGFPVASIRMIDGEERTEVTADQWAGVLGVLESPDLFNVSTALWGLHEWEPAQRAVEAKKALTKKSSGRSRKL